jgi:hypothetical protein
MRSLVVLTIVLSGSRLAAADDVAKADALFEEAQQLKAQGKATDACKKYDEALLHNRNAVGTLLNVGLCNEEAGKYASAVKHYTQARDLAREHNLSEHRQAAEERLAATTPLVARLAIAFAEKPDNMKLLIDEEVVPLDKSDDIVVDPGKHHIVVTAPGRVPYDSYIEVDKSSAKAIAIPKLGYPVTVKKSRRTVGKILTFSGAGLAVTGVVLGAYARSKYNGQVGDPLMGANCNEATEPLECNAEGYRITNDARTFGTFGSIIGVSGVAILGVGVYLWFFGPSAPAERDVAIVPTIDPTGSSATLSAFGRF